MKKLILTLMVGALCALNAADTVVKLPEPNKKGGMPLMEALANRKSSRAFNSKADIQPDILGDLLWATWGFNRPGMRTAPTAINLQELDVYVLKADGCWFYDAQNNALVKKGDKDLREATVANIGFPLSRQRTKFTAAAEVITYPATAKLFSFLTLSAESPNR